MAILTVNQPKTKSTKSGRGRLANEKWTFVLPALLPESAPMAVWVLTFVIAGVLMGLTVGLVTGVALLRMEPVPAGHNSPTDSSG